MISNWLKPISARWPSVRLKTIETDSGKIIDILRTADGAEIYVDGELLEMNFDDEGPA